MRVRSNLPALRRQLLRKLDAEVEKANEAAAKEMRRGAPVDERELVESIEEQAIGPARHGITIGAGHWRYVNYGTRHMPAEPFVEPGIEVGKQRLRRARIDR